MITAISCDPPTEGHNSEIIGDQFTFGKNVTYECDLGYEIEYGDHIRNCMAEKKWSGDPLSCKRKYRCFVL